MPSNFIEQQIEKVLKEHPLLTYNNSTKMFFGTLITDTNDSDSYSVEIYLNRFPFSFPLVREVGERIPPKADRHKYKDDYCCFTTEAKERILLKKRIFTLSDFISLIAIPYFQNNSFYEINTRYLFGEYSHGPIGLLEAYKEIFDVSCSKSVEKILLDYLIGKLQLTNQACYCGSGKTISNCHINNFKDLHILGKDLVKRDLNLIFLYYKINQPK
jgi:hypothetical protein